MGIAYEPDEDAAALRVEGPGRARTLEVAELRAFWEDA